MPLAGRPMIEWSIDALRASGSVRSIVVAVPPGHVHGFGGHDLGDGDGDGDDLGEGDHDLRGGDRDPRVVSGGATRAQSVANALEAVDTGLVAIHDAARPLLTAKLVEELVARLDADQEAAGAIAAAPVTDTIKQATEASGAGTNDALSGSGRENASLVIRQTLDRVRLWAAQTPQVFRTEALRAALEVDLEVRHAATDEAMLVEAAGGRVLIHPSPVENLKVTTPLDLRVAELLLADRAAHD